MYTKAFAYMILAATLTSLSQGVVVTLYKGKGCKGEVAGTRNVWDDTCATGTPGYQSWKITTKSTTPQIITSFSHDACAGPTTASTKGDDVGTCHDAVDSAGGSNAMNSRPDVEVGGDHASSGASILKGAASALRNL